MELCCLLMTFLELIRVSLGVSVARGKPTTQGTTNNGYISANAVDGVYESNVYQNDCAVVRTWDMYWTVDLQGMYTISKLDIYNRQDDQGNLDNVVVEVFLGDPQLCPNFGVLCGRNPGPSGDLVTIYCPNNTLARFVRLSGKAYMSLCEVDVFGEIVKDCNPLSKYGLQKLPGVILNSSKSFLGTARSPVDCLALCKERDSFCHTINFDVLNGTCFTTRQPVGKNVYGEIANWNLYYRC